MAASKQMLRILKARERVANKDKWFADVIYNFPLIECDTIPTMDTNGICIRFNPDFVDDNFDHIEGVFCHEGWHPILDHIRRRGTRDAKDWNIACDAVINPIVRRRGWNLPDGAVFIKAVEAQRMSAERAYEYIKEQRTKQPKLPVPPGGEEQETTEGPAEDQQDQPKEETQDDKPTDKDIPDQEGSERMKEPTPEELEDFRQKIERSIQSATEKAVKGGWMDPVIKHALELDDKDAPPLNWEEVLQDMVATNRNDEARSWARPNRRYLGQGEIRPGYLRDQINRLIVLYDTSGSVYDTAIRQMKKVTADLLANHTISAITMISVDTEIQAMGDVTTPEEVLDFDLKIKHGGTSFYSAMKAVGEIEDKIGVVFLTDMQTLHFGEDPMVPVVWVNWGRDVRPGEQFWPPYGRVVKYQNRD